MKLVSKVFLFTAIAAVFSFVSAEKADAQIFKRIFGGCGDGYTQRGFFCIKAEEEAAPEPEPEPEPAPMMCCEAAPAPAPEPVPMMCCEAAPEPAPEPVPMPCCCEAAPEPAPMPCCQPAPAPAPCCAGLAPPTVGPGETLVSVSPLSFPTDAGSLSPIAQSTEATAILEVPATEIPVTIAPVKEVVGAVGTQQ